MPVSETGGGGVGGGGTGLVGDVIGGETEDVVGGGAGLFGDVIGGGTGAIGPLISIEFVGPSFFLVFLGGGSVRFLASSNISAQFIVALNRRGRPFFPPPKTRSSLVRECCFGSMKRVFLFAFLSVSRLLVFEGRVAVSFDENI